MPAKNPAIAPATIAAFQWQQEEYVEDVAAHLPKVYGAEVAHKLLARLKVEAAHCKVVGGRVAILASGSPPNSTIDGGRLRSFGLHVGPPLLPIRSMIYVDVRAGKVTLLTGRYDDETATETLVATDSPSCRSCTHFARWVVLLLGWSRPPWVVPYLSLRRALSSVKRVYERAYPGVECPVLTARAAADIGEVRDAVPPSSQAPPTHALPRTPHRAAARLSLATTTASIRRHLADVNLEEEAEDDESANPDTSVLTRPDDIDEAVVQEVNEEEMHDASLATLDATMLSAGARRSLTQPVDHSDASMYEASAEDNDEEMPLERRRVKVVRRLAKRAKDVESTMEVDDEELAPLAPPSPQPPRHILTAARHLVLKREHSPAFDPLDDDAFFEQQPIEAGSPHYAASPPHRRSPGIEEHSCSPLKRARMSTATLERLLEEAKEEAHRANVRSQRYNLLLHDEWAMREGARADTYRLADEVVALEADLLAEKARTLAAHKTAVAIADAAAVSQALQPAQPAAQPAVPAAAVAGPAQNPAFAASMAAIKARLLAYLSAPGHQTKGATNDRLTSCWRSLTTTVGKRLKELREAVSTGAARLTAGTIADPAYAQQLTDFEVDATRMADEFDELLAHVEDYGRKILAEHAATGRTVRWTKRGYGDEYDLIKEQAKHNLETLRGFRESRQ
ncbi:hypothetical protein PRIPAC_89954 [Pristionchus pacificus]|uniref:Uncharacterized protein n=1 Tax=Pristionchus pacificus TaxID=54126 RepID=A0A2A6CTM9_PRIPA|nr:hypothetical protein PRIPAC_89954 [Pristionchus pacificus]|eukprot:PDM81407.1 hypothetical protein PRIPAC_35283 [Pristionchus pacificus]